MTQSIYEVIQEDIGSVVKRTDADGTVWWIPTDPANSDYQRYLNPETDHPIGGE